MHKNFSRKLYIQPFLSCDICVPENHLTTQNSAVETTRFREKMGLGYNTQKLSLVSE